MNTVSVDKALFTIVVQALKAHNILPEYHENLSKAINPVPDATYMRFCQIDGAVYSGIFLTPIVEGWEEGYTQFTQDPKQITHLPIGATDVYEQRLQESKKAKAADKEKVKA